MKEMNVNVKLIFRQYRIDPSFPIFVFAKGCWPNDNFFVALENGSSHRYMHFHNCLELGYCFSGEEHFVTDTNKSDIRSGDVSMILPYTAHRTSKKGTNVYTEYLYIDVSQLMKNMGFEGVLPQGLFDSINNSASQVLCHEKYPEITALVSDILLEFRTKPSNYREVIKALAMALIFKLSRVISQTTQVSSGRQQLFLLYPVIQRLNACYMERIRVDALHQDCFISATHFRRLFHEIMGCSPLEYLHYLRINKACQLLYSSSKPVLDIAMSVGYESISSFNRQFIKLIGLSPSNWRKQRLYGHNKALPVSIYDPVPQAARDES